MADYYTTPQQWSNLTGWTSVVVNSSAICGIRSGALYCWGSAYGYTLGDGTTELSSTPLRIGTDSDWTLADFGAGIRGGQLYTWGDNFFGRVGNGQSGQGVYQKTPARIGLAADWTSVSAKAPNYTCGVRGGMGYCWGNNNGGELGIGTDADPVTPTQVSLNVTWQRIEGGNQGSCGISNNTAYCWGANALGQIGDGTTVARLSPVPVVFP
jgi:alpha-tubulin suppressor-like RCC1 family protein